MRNRLFNAKQVSAWANKKMNNFNANLRAWADQDDAMPYGKATVPKEFYSNDAKTLDKALHKYYGDKAAMKYPKANDTLLENKDGLKEKYDYAQLSSYAKACPWMHAYEGDLEKGFVTPSKMVHLYGFYNVHSDKYSASAVAKDKRKIGRLKTINYEDYLDKNPKFAKAIGVITAPQLYKYNKAHGFSKRNKKLTNMAEYYDRQSVLKYATNGHNYINVFPENVQARALYYIHHKNVAQGRELPYSILQGNALYNGAKHDKNYSINQGLRDSPELLNALHTRPVGSHTVCDMDTQGPISKEMVLARDRSFMVKKCKSLLNQMNNSESKQRSNNVIKQAEDIVKQASQDKPKQAKAQRPSKTEEAKQVRETPLLHKMAQTQRIEMKRVKPFMSNYEYTTLRKQFRYENAQEINRVIGDPKRAQQFARADPNFKQTRKSIGLEQKATKLGLMNKGDYQYKLDMHNYHKYQTQKRHQKSSFVNSYGHLDTKKLNAEIHNASMGFGKFFSDNPDHAMELHVFSSIHSKNILKENIDRIKDFVKKGKVPKDIGRNLVKDNQDKIKQIKPGWAYSGKTLHAGKRLHAVGPYDIHSLAEKHPHDRKLRNLDRPRKINFDPVKNPVPVYSTHRRARPHKSPNYYNKMLKKASRHNSSARRRVKSHSHRAKNNYRKAVKELRTATNHRTRGHINRGHGFERT